MEGVPTEDDDYQSRYSGIELFLPNRDEPVVAIQVEAPDQNLIDIVINQDNEPDRGERVLFKEFEGELQWRIGPHNRYNSLVLEKKIDMDYEHDYLSLEPLSPPDFDKLAKIIHGAYEAGREKDNLEYMRSVEGPSVWRPE